jgi:hypothetical protein
VTSGDNSPAPTRLAPQARCATGLRTDLRGLFRQAWIVLVPNAGMLSMARDAVDNPQYKELTQSGRRRKSGNHVG